MSTAQNLYTREVKNLPPLERLRLATMIMQELSREPSPLENGPCRQFAIGNIEEEIAYSGRAQKHVPIDDLG